MRKAVMDIGTNSVRLLVAELTEDGWHTLLKTLRTTRLGEGLVRGGTLSEAACRRTKDAVWELVDEARRHEVEVITIVGTNAMREAADGKEFATQLATEIGVPVRILAGEEEARYSYLGASGGGSQLTAVVDIGGGSTEVGVGFGGELGVAVSMPIGAVRGTRDFDMMTPRGMSELKKQCFALLKEHTQEITDVRRWIGVGGTLTSIAAMLLELDEYSAERVQGQVVTAEQVHELLLRLGGMSYEERAAVPGLDPERADIIVAGIVIAESIMEYFALPELRVSDADLLEGICQEIVENVG